MSWHRLDSEKSQKMLDAVKSSGEALLFSQKNNEVKCMRLPFYNDFLLYRIENTATLPIFSMDFLGHNEEFFHLDGTDGALQAVSKKSQLSLRDDNIAAYLQVYFFNVIQDDGEIYPLFEGSPLPDLDNQNIHASLDSIPVGTPGFQATLENNSFSVVAPLFYDGTLMQGTLAVSMDGKVEITGITPLLGNTFNDSIGDSL